MSWQHYQYGLTSIARETLRHQLLLAQATRMSTQPKVEWEEYQRDIGRLTEVPKHG